MPRPKMTRQAYEREMAAALDSALRDATAGHLTTRHVANSSAKHSLVDVVVELAAGDMPVEVAVEVIRFAYPRDVQRAVWKLDEYKRVSERPEDLMLFVAAESLSPGAKALLRRHGIGYFERNGNLFLRWRDWLINIERPNLPSIKTEALSLFTDSRERVIHALLIHRNEWITAAHLADITGTSPYTCSVVLQELERREWCESSTGAGRLRLRRLSAPRALLDAWAEHWTRRTHHRSRWYAFVEHGDQLLARLTDQIEKANLPLDWAFTGAAAANAYAPLLTGVDSAAMIVPPGSAETLAHAIGLRPADKGGNVTLVERDGASLLFRQPRSAYGACFASPFVLYLDLLDGRGRNKELAQHLLEKLEL
ncbi:type IV toxin-antitoxin system AbiEi family antitoxin [Pararobbsia silviterrae]|uniref:Uncharacterized protein n=1 Tax=Pararobbsia silviterrae TaxID=1792498 RepID=A0A494X633_9BURK|nr:type IV toxin-antitoxin system AbiEi family antitoxin [Pararobbsia silviterrae]RKP46147.1 hypothetical protein D7S86_24800 [Pararobbsia silviterrae]